MCGRETFVRVVEIMQAERLLLEIVGALYPTSRFTGSLHGWQQ
jgi:hypothetical protein